MFDAQISRFDAKTKAALVDDEGIIRNRLELDFAVMHAEAFLAVQKEFELVRSLHLILRSRRTAERPRTLGDVTSADVSPTHGPDLKSVRFRFVGSTIVATRSCRHAALSTTTSRAASERLTA